MAAMFWWELAFHAILPLFSYDLNSFIWWDLNVDFYGAIKIHIKIVSWYGKLCNHKLSNVIDNEELIM